jgi:hypothetical protein
VTRIKTILLSFSLVAATAAPALANDGFASGQAPTRFPRDARRSDPQVDRQNADEQLRLEQVLAAKSAAERDRLEEELRRTRANGRETQIQREWLAEKQLLRDAHEREWLADKQRARAENDRVWLADKDRIRAQYERAWQPEKERARVAYERAGLGFDHEVLADVYDRDVLR